MKNERDDDPRSGEESIREDGGASNADAIGTVEPGKGRDAGEDVERRKV